MTTTDPAFLSAFAKRVRTTVATIPEGSPTVNTTTATETGEAPAVPATFQAAPCPLHAWCVETGQHVHHFSERIAFPADGQKATILTASLYTDQPAGLPNLWWDRGLDTDVEFTSGDQLRAETARVRAHLARVDAFADRYDAIREAAGQAVPGPVQPPQPLVLDDEGVPEGAARIPSNADGTQPLLTAHLEEASGTLLMGVDGLVSADLDIAEARRLWSDTAKFLARLGAMITEWAGHEAPPHAAKKPRTWSFESRDGGSTETVTCMLGCRRGHEVEQSQPFPMDEVSCHVCDYGAEVPIEAGGQATTEEVLHIRTLMQPWHRTMAKRLPHVQLELVEDHFIDGLDPDGLQVVINTFQSRVDAMRRARTHLIAARAEYMRRAR